VSLCYTFSYYNLRVSIKHPVFDTVTNSTLHSKMLMTGHVSNEKPCLVLLGFSDFYWVLLGKPEVQHLRARPRRARYTVDMRESRHYEYRASGKVIMQFSSILLGVQQMTIRLFLLGVSSRKTQQNQPLEVDVSYWVSSYQ